MSNIHNSGGSVLSKVKIVWCAALVSAVIYLICVFSIFDRDKRTSWTQSVKLLICENRLSHEIWAKCDSKSINKREKELKREILSEYANELLELNKRILRAHRYARSTKSLFELNQAFEISNFLLDQIYHNMTKNILSKSADFMDEDKNGTFLTVTSSSSNENSDPLEVCPEKYMGMTYGYPYYYTGHMTDYDNCTAPPIETKLSVLLNAITDIDRFQLESVLKGISGYYRKLPTIIALSDQLSDTIKEQMAKKARQLLVNVKFVTFKDTTIKSAQIWKTLAEQTKTKYVLVARGLIHFDNHTSLERLLRFSSYLNIDAVAGSHRFLDGRWFRGCYAAAMRNYTYKLVDGYDLSYNSCIYCDYASGPFLTKRELFLKRLDPEMTTDDQTFLDFFATFPHRNGKNAKSSFSELQLKTMVCPDVMFVVRDDQLILDSKLNSKKDNFIQFVQKFELNRVILPDKSDLLFSCSESKVTCTRKRGMIMPICCLQELADMMKFLAEMCEKHNIPLEMEAGSNVGAMKMYGVTPYERDADFDWLVFKHHEMQAMAPEFEKRGYKLEPNPKIDDKTTKCLKETGVNCGYYAFRSNNWRIELWGVTHLGSDEAFRVGLKNRTKILMDGMWINAMHSPAANARNEYGDDIFEHIEHWGTLGYNTGWVQPPTGNFSVCPTPGFHGCLDIYMPVGNIQFQDIWI